MHKSPEQGDLAFRRFLAALSSDQEISPRLYQELRDKLVRYFSMRGLLRADEAADETIDRVVKKIEEGSDIDNVTRYSFGVARLIMLEYLRKQGNEAGALRLMGQQDEPSDEKDEALLANYLRECLEETPSEDRSLVLQYYSFKGKHSKDREKIAEEYNLTLNHLRVKIFRIKKRLGKCVEGKRAD